MQKSNLAALLFAPAPSDPANVPQKPDNPERICSPIIFKSLHRSLPNKIPMDYAVGLVIGGFRYSSHLLL